MVVKKYRQGLSRTFRAACCRCRKCVTLKYLKTVIVFLAAFTSSCAFMLTLQLRVHTGGNNSQLPMLGTELLHERRGAEDNTTAAAATLTPVMFIVYNFNTSDWCRGGRNAHASSLRELCGQYHSGLVTGNLCPALCDTRQIQVTGCLKVGNRKQVLKATCNDSCIAGRNVTAFLKTSVLQLSDALSQIPDLPAAADYLSTTTKLVVTSLEMFMPFLPFPRQEALKVMWGDLDLQLANATVRSLLLLLGQAEYVLSKALGQFRVFPQIYGSCGHFYLQESCPALETFILQKKSWLSRATAALGMLEELRRMEAQLPDPIIACDMKVDNFGTCADGDLRLLDLADIFFNASMSTARGQKKRCRTNDDCRVHGMKGCQGRCNTDSGTCYMAVNDNLEFLCRRVFMTRVSHRRTDYDTFDKVLRDPPRNVTSDLNEVLHDCEHLSSTLMHEPDAGQRLMQRLEAVLKRSLGL